MYDPQNLLDLDSLGIKLDSLDANELDLLCAVRTPKAVEIRKEVLRKDNQFPTSTHNLSTDASDHILDVLLSNREYLSAIDLSMSTVEAKQLPASDDFLVRNFQLAELVEMESRKNHPNGKSKQQQGSLSLSFRYLGQTLTGNKFQLVESLSHGIYRSIKRRSQLDQESFNVSFVQSAVSKVSMCIALMMNVFDAGGRALFVLNALFSSSHRTFRAILPLEVPTITTDEYRGAIPGTQIGVRCPLKFEMEFQFGKPVTICVEIRMTFVIGLSSQPFITEHIVSVQSPIVENSKQRVVVVGAGLPRANGEYTLNGYRCFNEMFYNESSGFAIWLDKKDHVWCMGKESVVYYKTDKLQQPSGDPARWSDYLSGLTWSVIAKKGISPSPSVDVILTPEVHHVDAMESKSSGDHAHLSVNSLFTLHSREADALGLPSIPPWLNSNALTRGVSLPQRLDKFPPELGQSQPGTPSIPERTRSGSQTVQHNVLLPQMAPLSKTLDFENAGTGAREGSLVELAKARFTLQSSLCLDKLSKKPVSPGPWANTRASDQTRVTGRVHQESIQTNEHENKWDKWRTLRSTNLRTIYELSRFALPSMLCPAGTGPALRVSSVVLPEELYAEYIAQSISSVHICASLMYCSENVPGTGTLETEKSLLDDCEYSQELHVRRISFQQGHFHWGGYLGEVPAATKVVLVLYGTISSSAPWSKGSYVCKLAVSVVPLFGVSNLERNGQVVWHMWPGPTTSAGESLNAPLSRHQSPSYLSSRKPNAKLESISRANSKKISGDKAESDPNRKHEASHATIAPPAAALSLEALIPRPQAPTHRRRDSKLGYGNLIAAAESGCFWMGQPDVERVAHVPRVVLHFGSGGVRVADYTELLNPQVLTQPSMLEFCRRAKFLCSLVDCGPMARAVNEVLSQMRSQRREAGSSSSRVMLRSRFSEGDKGLKSPLGQSAQNLHLRAGDGTHQHRRIRSETKSVFMANKQAVPQTDGEINAQRYLVHQALRDELFRRYVGQGSCQLQFQSILRERIREHASSNHSAPREKLQSDYFGVHWPHNSLPCVELYCKPLHRGDRHRRKQQKETDMSNSQTESPREQHNNHKASRSTHPLSIEVDAIVDKCVTLVSQTMRVIAKPFQGKTHVNKSKEYSPHESDGTKRASAIFSQTAEHVSPAQVERARQLENEWHLDTLMETILTKAPETLNSDEKSFCFLNRSRLEVIPDAILHFVLSTNWFDGSQSLEAIRMVCSWSTPSIGLVVQMLAHPQVLNPIVRLYCVTVLHQCCLKDDNDDSRWMTAGEGGDSTCDILTMLIVGLKLESQHDSPLARFLLWLALKFQPSVGKRFVGVLQLILDNSLLDRQRFALVLETYVHCSGD